MNATPKGRDPEDESGPRGSESMQVENSAAAADSKVIELGGSAKGGSVSIADSVFARLIELSYRHLKSRCESPIEVTMLRSLLAHFSIGRGTGEAVGESPFGTLYQQHEVTVEGSNYRLDFAVIAPGLNLAIECDGHDFHERTKEQAANDKSRDRAFTRAGWAPLRFTGSEIHRNADGCALEVIQTIRSLSSGELTRDMVADRPDRQRPITLVELAKQTEKAIAGLGPRPRFF